MSETRGREVGRGMWKTSAGGKGNCTNRFHVSSSTHTISNVQVSSRRSALYGRAFPCTHHAHPRSKPVQSTMLPTTKPSWPRQQPRTPSPSPSPSPPPPPSPSPSSPPSPNQQQQPLFYQSIMPLPYNLVERIRVAFEENLRTSFPLHPRNYGQLKKL